MTDLEIPHGNEDEKSKKDFINLDSLVDFEKLRLYLSASLTKATERVSMDTIRPLPVFLGISGPSFCFSADAFTTPSKKFDKNTAEKVSNRISLNLNFFISNYAMIFVGTCIIVTLMHPGMIVYSALVYGLWKGHNAMVENNMKMILMEKDIGEFLTVGLRTKILYLITFWVVVAKCFKPFLIVLGLTSLLVIFHACMRDPKHIKANNFHTNDGISTDEVDSQESAVVVEKSDAM